ncbi:hypothetical protein M2341_002050 [Sphingobium sp. B7D2B]|uniref:hypothetical protein n=1 Tax=Sphingobium sp. B7D2B TaxID=2940583 RepID=UPI002224E0C0|nr:hypothetical protein [Sphingobium sp. B7D2B]MCW2366603.1 hypothetical protein [Sphingobium sp. B7D2B]
MNQAVLAPITRVFFPEPRLATAAAMLAPPHLWRLTDDQRAMIDWARSELMLLIDDFSELAPTEVLNILGSSTAYQRCIVEGLISPLDRTRLTAAVARCEALLGEFYDRSPHELLQSLMLAATLLVTGTEYDRPDAPEDYHQ